MECLLKGESPKTHEKKRRTVVYDREYIYQYIRNTVMKPLKFSDAESFCGYFQKLAKEFEEEKE